MSHFGNWLRLWKQAGDAGTKRFSARRWIMHVRYRQVVGVIALLLLALSSLAGADGRSTLTLDNQSGE